MRSKMLPSLLALSLLLLASGCRKGHLTVEPAVVDFGERWVGMNSEELHFQWINQGPRTVIAGGDATQFKAPFAGRGVFTGLTLPPPAQAAGIVNPMLPGLPQANETPWFSVSFQPTAAGDFEQVLNPVLGGIAENWRDGKENNFFDVLMGTYFYYPVVVKGKGRVYQQKGALSLEGGYIQPAAGSDYVPLDFGDIVAGTRSYRTLTLRNNSAMPGTAHVFWTASGNNSQWTDVGGPFSASLSSGASPQASYQVPPNGTLTLVLTFAPRHAGSYRQAVVFVDGVISLIGVPGNAAVQMLDPASPLWSRTGYLLTGRAHGGE